MMFFIRFWTVLKSAKYEVKNLYLYLQFQGGFFHGSGFFRIGSGISADSDPDAGKKVRSGSGKNPDPKHCLKTVLNTEQWRRKLARYTGTVTHNNKHKHISTAFSSSFSSNEEKEKRCFLSFFYVNPGHLKTEVMKRAETDSKIGLGYLFFVVSENQVEVVI